VKTLAFVFGLCIIAVGVVGIVAPSALVWLAQQFVTSGVLSADSKGDKGKDNEKEKARACDVRRACGDGSLHRIRIAC
jgi:hypothetical protein